MCGIVGLVSETAQPLERSDAAQRMLAKLEHRGPDKSELVTLGDCTLGCARLAVVDAFTSNQPRVAENTAFTFNGEVFNHIELRTRLNGPLGGWTTGGDTEVLHYLLIERELDALDMVEGQYALAFWSLADSTITLARDRDGIVPLYYRLAPGYGLAFASEVWPLVNPTQAFPRVAPSLSRSLLAGVLWGCPPSQSVFEGIEQVDRGETVTFTVQGQVTA